MVQQDQKARMHDEQASLGLFNEGKHAAQQRRLAHEMSSTGKVLVY